MALSREQFDALRAKGLSVEQIVRFESGERGQTLAPTGQAPTAPAPRQRRPVALPMHPLAGLVSQGYDLPSLLATPGGFLPGATGRGLAALGGGAGEFLQEAILGQPLSPGGMVRQAGTQAALTAGGQLLGGTSRAIGTGLMRTALRPGVNTIRRAPEAVKDALEQTATVRRFVGTGGEQKAAEVMGQRGAITERGLERASRAAINVPGVGTARYRPRMNAMMPKVNELVAKHSAERDKEMALAKEVIRDYVKQHPGPYDPNDLKAFKKDLWARAQKIFDDANQGKNLQLNKAGIPTDPNTPIESRVYLGIARNINKYLEAIPESVVGIKGGLKASEAATAKSIGVHKAVSDATLRGESGLPTWFPQGFGRGAITAGGGAIGAMQGDSPQERAAGGAIGGLAGGLLSDPGVTSRLAHLFYQQYLLPSLLRQAPRAGFMMFNDGTMPPDTLINQPGGQR